MRARGRHRGGLVDDPVPAAAARGARSARYPGVRLQLFNVTGKDGLALLRRDQVDFAFGSMLDVPHDLSYEPVQWFDPMLIVPRDHPLAERTDIKLEDLSPYGLILPPQRLTTYRLVDLVFQQRRVPYRVAIEVGGWEVIKEYVAMGLGISIVTGICLTEHDKTRLHVRNLRQYFPQRSYGVVMRKGKYLSTQARVRRSDPARSVRSRRIRRIRALGTLTRPRAQRSRAGSKRKPTPYTDSIGSYPSSLNLRRRLRIWESTVRSLTTRWSS